MCIRDRLGNDLEQIADDTVVSHLEDGGGVVLVHGDDALGVLHTSSVLDSAGNAQSNIDLGVHGLAGLTNLMVSGHPACIGNGTGSTHNAAAQCSSQLLSQLDALVDVLADTTANRDDDVCTDEVDQLLSCLLNAQDLSLDVVSGQAECGLHDLAGIGLGLIEGSLLPVSYTHLGGRRRR